MNSALNKKSVLSGEWSLS